MPRGLPRGSLLVFIYSEHGVAVIPAFSVSCSAKNSISSKDSFYKALDSFYTEFYKCFIGDQDLAKDYRNPADLKKIATKLKAQHAIAITAKIGRFG